MNENQTILENIKTIKVKYMMHYVHPNCKDWWKECEMDITLDFAMNNMPKFGSRLVLFKAPVFRVQIPCKYDYLPLALPFTKVEVEQLKSKTFADDVGNMNMCGGFETYFNSYALFYLNHENALKAYKKVCKEIIKWSIKTYELYEIDKSKKESIENELEILRLNGIEQLKKIRAKLAK